MFSFLFCYVVICFNEELEMEDQETFFSGMGKQSPCTVSPPGFDRTKVKVVQSHSQMSEHLPNTTCLG